MSIKPPANCHKLQQKIIHCTDSIKAAFEEVLLADEMEKKSGTGRVECDVNKLLSTNQWV